MQVWFPTIRAGSGVDVYVRRLAGGLEKKGINCRISWYDRRFEFAPWLLRGVRPPHGTDIIHGNTWNAYAFAQAGIPLVVTEHHCVLDHAITPYKSTAQRLYHRLFIAHFERASLRRANAVIAVSQATADSLRSVFGIRNAAVIHNWIDYQRFTPGPTHSRSAHPFKLLYVGNQSRRKGWDQAVAVMTALGQDFHLYATTGLRDSKKRLARDNITFLGRLSDAELVNRYRQCDALLFPSRYEGFGYVALEAMACGKPVVGAGNTAIPELVVDGATGMLCEPEDTACYVAACHRLRQDQELRARFGAAARQRAVEQFNEDALVQRYISVYEQLLDG